MSMVNTWKMVGVAATLALAGLVSSASADVSDVAFDVVVCKGGVCTGYFWVPSTDLTEDPSTGVLSWHLQQDTDITDLEGDVAGTLQVGSFVEIIPAGRGRATTQVNLGFAVEAGDALTDFSFSSAMLSFPAIASAQGKADATFQLTDFGGDSGATLTGLFGGGGAYRAQYNGFPGTQFTQLMTAPIAVGEFESISVPDSFGFAPIGASVSSISSQIDFSLSAFDLASGLSTFEVIPEPAAALLLVVGVMALRRR